MKVSVVIVGYRNAADIARCLSALDGCDHPDFDVVVVENGGAEAFAALRVAVPTRLAAGQAVRLVAASGNLGFAGGVNLGMRETPAADAWWILNPDTMPAPGALRALVARLARGDCEAVGGVLHFADRRIQSLGGQWQAWIARATAIAAGRSLDDRLDADAVEAQLEYLTGASMLVGRRFLDGTGPMREDYFLYAEEIEWFVRARKRGMRLGFAPEAHVLHHQGTTTGWANSIRNRPKLPIYLDERNRLLLTRDQFPGRLPVTAVAQLLFMLARFTRKRAWRQIGFATKGWLAGLSGERGVPGWMRG